MIEQLEFGIIGVKGEDAETFLQGQFTCDMTQVTEKYSYGAYCDAKGRIIANFAINRIDEGFLVYLPEVMLEIMYLQLRKFAQFSKVEIASLAIDKEVPNFKPMDMSECIKFGIVWITPGTSLKFIPQMINWEKVGGVSFTKGCYVGQEVVARTQNLGKLKRHLYQFMLLYSDKMISEGDKIVSADGTEAGLVCNIITRNDDQYFGLGVLQDSALTKQLWLNEANIWTRALTSKP